MIHQTSMKKLPFVSILIVNFNGRQLLDECLSSVFALSYPRILFEVIVIDNNSTDDSVPFLLQRYPAVKLIQQHTNTGFTGGNIAGFSEARGEYIVLLNNDVRVDSNWLSALVNAAKDDEVGIVSSRLKFAFPFIELTIESGAVPKSLIDRTIDHSPVGVLLEDIVCETEAFTSLIFYKSGFYEKRKGEICTHRSEGASTVLLPLNPEKKSNSYILTLHGLESEEAINLPVIIRIGRHTLQKMLLKPHESKQINLCLETSLLKKHQKWLMQNAGNIILANGFSKDRGNVLVTQEQGRAQTYEEDSSFFDQSVSLLAACGASCLIKRAVIDEVGFLDDTYFMYYEDIDFSLRAWRAGWKIVYAPKSIGFHKHRATTGNDDSAFFLYHVERNRMALIAAHFPMRTMLIETLFFFNRLIVTSLKFFLFQFLDNEARSEIWRRKFEGRKAAFLYLLHVFPRLIKTRIYLNNRWPINQKMMVKMMY